MAQAISAVLLNVATVIAFANGILRDVLKISNAIAIPEIWFFSKTQGPEIRSPI